MSTEVSTEQLEALNQLQATDSRIARLEHQLDRLPEQQALEKAEQEGADLREQHDAKRLELDRTRKESDRLEGEIDLLRQRYDAEQARMYGGEISNPKELQSLRAEIESTQRRISDHEDQLLEVMEQRETLESQASALVSRAEEADAQIARRTQERDEAAQGLLAELAETRVERDRHREQLPASMLERYDAMRQRFAGIAVGELENGMCTACRIELPIAEVNELYDGPPLATCPNCGRMLVVT